MLKTWAFRLCLIYYLLYALPLLLGMLPGVGMVAGWWYSGQTLVARWVVVHLLGLPEHAPPVPTWYLDHRGDDLLELVACVAALVIAVLVSTAWTAFQRRGSNQRWLYAWVDALVRFTLAGVMMAYGWSKLFPQQFNGGAVPLPWLLWRLGDYSPQHLLWIFMGFSRPYAIFAGAGEMLGALLVCSRRTATFGALVLIAALSNVVVTNFAYDVPVKVFSVNLLLMAVFVTARDARRLAAVFVLGRPVPAAPPPPPLFASQRASAVMPTVAVLLALWLLGSPLPSIAENIGGLHFTREPPPEFGGVFDVEPPTALGGGPERTIPASVDWQRMVLTRHSAVARTRADSSVRYDLTADTVTRRLTLSGLAPQSQPAVFRYEIPDSANLLLREDGPADTRVIRLRRTELTLLRWKHFWSW